MKQLLHLMSRKPHRVAFVNCELWHWTWRVRSGSCASSRTLYVEYRDPVEVLTEYNANSKLISTGKGFGPSVLPWYP